MKKILSLIAFFLILKDSTGQTLFPPRSYENKLKIEAKPANGKIIIDGKLNESDWAQCMPAKNFMQCYPEQEKTATFDTEVKILYDEKNVYFGAICHNPGNKIFVQDLRRDFLYGNNELFGIFLDPFRDVQNPVPSFLVTPYGTQRDLLIYDDRIYDLNWDAVWQANSFIADSFWSTEIAIPWSTLRYPSDSTTWGINFNRNIRSLYQVTGWSAWPVAYTVGRIAYGGLVTNLHPPKSKSNIRIQPYSLLNVSDKRQEQTNTKIKAGGEIKWMMNTTTSLEATVNTDFAQADVDRQVVNLNRSSVFFPEKRQFFLENANLFSIGQDEIVQPFFSRRIGLDNNGNPLTINEGLRFIHQTGKRAAGLLFVRQKDNDTDTHTYFGVVRGQNNIGSRGRVGVLAIFRHDELINASNTVLCADGFWQSAGPLYLRPMISTALSTGSSKKGITLFNELGYVKNKFSFKWIEAVVANEYMPKTGFLSRNNFIYTHPEIAFTILTHWMNDKIRLFTPAATADIFHNSMNGEFEEANIIIRPFFINTSKGTTAWLGLLPSWQKLNSDFNPVPDITIKPGNYNYLRYNLNLSTNLSAPYSVVADVTVGKFYNGDLNSYSVSLRAVPVPKISATMNYTCNRFSGFDSTKKIITTHLIAPELRIFFSPKIQLSGFYQYNTITNLGGLNLRFSWEYKPLSFIFLVFNNLKTIDSKLTSNPVNDNTEILKISFIGQL